MVLTNLILAAIMVVLIGGSVFGMVLAVRTYLRYRGQRLVTCPETDRPAAVQVDATKAMTATLLGKQEVRLDQCSRWPEKRNCGQECLSQVNADPQQCLVWNIVADWYKGKSCAYCQKPFGEIHWHDRHPGVLTPSTSSNSGMKFQRNNCPRHSRRTCRSAGTATWQKPSGGRIRILC